MAIDEADGLAALDRGDGHETGIGEQFAAAMPCRDAILVFVIAHRGGRGGQQGLVARPQNARFHAAPRRSQSGLTFPR